MTNYLTAEELVNKTLEKIVLLPSQEDALWNIASVINLHFRRLQAIERGVDIDTLPIISQLYIAPTGCGKTYLISQLAQAAGLEFCTIDTSTLTLSGYKGINLDEAFRNLKLRVRNKSKLETAIILFDEFDKVSNREDERGNVQANFLTLLEGKGISTKEGFIDTSKMLFLFAGAFQGIENLVEKSKPVSKSIGFIQSKPIQTSSEYRVTMDHIQQYGFNRELLSRIGSVYQMKKLTQEDYIKLINGIGASVKNKYNNLFTPNGIELIITDRACNVIANTAIERGLGARAVNSIVMETLNNAFKETDSNKNIAKVVLNAKDNNLVTEYIQGERTNYLPAKENINREFVNVSFVNIIRTERGINNLCNEMMKICCKSLTYERQQVCFYFLQIVLRYFSLELNEDDQCMASLVKMADTTEISDYTSTFDYLMEAALSKKSMGIGYSTFKYFVDCFKSVETMETHRILTMAVDKIKYEGKYLLDICSPSGKEKE